MKKHSWQIALGLLMAGAISGLFPPEATAQTRPAPTRPGAAGAAPELKLTGVTFFNGRKRAYFTMNQGGQPASYSLSEGQQLGPVSVSSIDITNGVVKVVFSGDSIDMSFKTHGVDAPAASAAPAAPTPPRQVAPVPTPGPRPAAGTAPVRNRRTQ
jgi:hypothetical protein